MPKFNQKGIIHLGLIVLLLLGIGIGTVVVQQRTDFTPSADRWYEDEEDGGGSDNEDSSEGDSGGDSDDSDNESDDNQPTSEDDSEDEQNKEPQNQEPEESNEPEEQPSPNQNSQESPEPEDNSSILERIGGSISGAVEDLANAGGDLLEKGGMLDPSPLREAKIEDAEEKAVQIQKEITDFLNDPEKKEENRKALINMLDLDQDKAQQALTDDQILINALDDKLAPFGVYVSGNSLESLVVRLATGEVAEVNLGGNSASDIQALRTAVPVLGRVIGLCQLGGFTTVCGLDLESPIPINNPDSTVKIPEGTPCIGLDGSSQTIQAGGGCGVKEDTDDQSLCATGFKSTDYSGDKCPVEDDPCDNPLFSGLNILGCAGPANTSGDTPDLSQATRVISETTTETTRHYRTLEAFEAIETFARLHPSYNRNGPGDYNDPQLSSHLDPDNNYLSSEYATKEGQRPDQRIQVLQLGEQVKLDDGKYTWIVTDDHSVRIAKIDENGNDVKHIALAAHAWGIDNEGNPRRPDLRVLTSGEIKVEDGQVLVDLRSGTFAQDGFSVRAPWQSTAENLRFAEVIISGVTGHNKIIGVDRVDSPQDFEIQRYNLRVYGPSSIPQEIASAPEDLDLPNNSQPWDGSRSLRTRTGQTVQIIPPNDQADGGIKTDDGARYMKLRSGEVVRISPDGSQSQLDSVRKNIVARIIDGFIKGSDRVLNGLTGRWSNIRPKGTLDLKRKRSIIANTRQIDNSASSSLNYFTLIKSVDAQTINKISSVAIPREYDIADATFKDIRETLLNKKLLTSGQAREILYDNLVKHPSGLRDDESIQVTTGDAGSVKFTLPASTFSIDAASIGGYDLTIPKNINPSKNSIIGIGIKPGSGKVNLISKYSIQIPFIYLALADSEEKSVQAAVYYDKNGNGRWDRGENVVPWAGVTVTLTDENYKAPRPSPSPSASSELQFYKIQLGPEITN